MRLVFNHFWYDGRQFTHLMPLWLRQVELWYAYRRAHGVLYKRYVGKSAGLTLARLEETAVWLNEVW